jgi:predicted transcriptional regulator
MDIIADILSVAREERKKTQIVYKANLDFRDGGYKTRRRKRGKNSCVITRR